MPVLVEGPVGIAVLLVAFFVARKLAKAAGKEVHEGNRILAMGSTVLAQEHMDRGGTGLVWAGGVFVMGVIIAVGIIIHSILRSWNP